MNAPVDLTKNNQDYAIFLPSIASMYAKFNSFKVISQRTGLPSGLTRGWEDLNFINDFTDLWSYKWFLYSAGHAFMDLEVGKVKDGFILNRDKSKTLQVGDSGGYQIATGTAKWPWKKRKTQSEQAWLNKKDNMRLQILRWLEYTSDYSMLLDFPPPAIANKGFDPVTGESLHPVLKSFRDCLHHSLDNAHFFIKHRVPGATKFLNILQGADKEKGDIWWHAIKDLPFEGWAFGGMQGNNLSLCLRRLIIMRDEKYLENKDWIHFLGNGKLQAACAFTTIQRILRKTVNNRLTVSYDSSTPFITTARGFVYYGINLNNNQLRFKTFPVPDDVSFIGNDTLLCDYFKKKYDEKNTSISSSVFNELFEHTSEHKSILTPSAISKKITLGDLCIKLNEKKTQEFNEIFVDYANVKYKSTLDGLSYVLLDNNNLELHIRGCQDACYWMSQPVSIAKNYLPPYILEFVDCCNEIMTAEYPMTLIDKNTKLLLKMFDKKDE